MITEMRENYQRLDQHTQRVLMGCVGWALTLLGIGLAGILVTLLH